MAEIKYVFPVRARYETPEIQTINNTMHAVGFDGDVVVESVFGDTTVTIPGDTPLKEKALEEMQGILQQIADNVMAARATHIKLIVGEARRIS